MRVFWRGLMASKFVRAVPNVISSLRLALAFVFPALPDDWRLPALIAGAMSDWIDGLIARRYKAMTVPGALLDAIADKLFTLSVLITIVMNGDAAWWQAVVVLLRDLAVAAIACYVMLVGRFDSFRRMRPRLPGKLTTTCVFIWLVALLAGAAAEAEWALFALAGMMSAIAGADYIGRFIRELRDHSSTMIST